MTQKHTPAPWISDHNTEEFEIWHETKDIHICTLNNYKKSEFDAHLIAAAPELLEALEAIYNSIESGAKNLNPQMCKVYAAILKARGEA